MTDYTAPLPAGELIRDLARATGHSQNEIRAILEALEVIVIRQIRTGRGARFPHLGTFDVRDTPARTRTVFGKRVEVPAGRRVVFRAGKQVKDVLSLP